MEEFSLYPLLAFPSLLAFSAVTAMTAESSFVLVLSHAPAVLVISNQQLTALSSRIQTFAGAGLLAVRLLKNAGRASEHRC